MNPEQLDLFDASFYGNTNVPVVVKTEKVPFVKKQKIKLVKAVEKIRMAEKVEVVTYLPSGLCQVWMPRNKTKEREYKMSNGTTSLLLQAGSLASLKHGGGMIEQGLPYGSLARLIFMFIVNTAVKTGKREIVLGESVHEFLVMLGLPTNGKYYKMITEQVNALICCHISIVQFRKGSLTQINSCLVTRFEAWLVKDDKQKVGFDSKIFLSPEFMRLCIESPVPFDFEVIKAIKHSPLRLDIYAYLVERLYRVTQEDGFVMTWEELRKLFGQEYAEMRHFKRKFILAVRDVLALYHEARVEIVSTGLKFRRSKPSVPFVAKKKIENNCQDK